MSMLVLRVVDLIACAAGSGMMRRAENACGCRSRRRGARSGIQLMCNYDLAVEFEAAWNSSSSERWCQSSTLKQVKNAKWMCSSRTQ
eukprot:3001302-Amphidinium_carterae.1